jgi:hypothetical protein
MLHRLILLGLLTAGLVRAEEFKESIAETHPLPAQGSVRVENENGAITIRTWERAEVSVQADKSASSEEYLKAIHVDIESGPDSISVKATSPKHELSWRNLFFWTWSLGESGSVRLTLMVPSAARLDRIAGVNGSITLEGTHGYADVTTVNGAIRATGLREGAFKTVNGSIHAEVDHFDSAAHLTATTVNGSVAILLPKDVGANVHASTVNGGISCDFPIEADNGVFGHNLHGNIGPGGGSIRVTTVNGAVHLQSL